jgi:hypothetical protein
MTIAVTEDVLKQVRAAGKGSVITITLKRGGDKSRVKTTLDALLKAQANTKWFGFHSQLKSHEAAVARLTTMAREGIIPQEQIDLVLLSGAVSNTAANTFFGLLLQSEWVVLENMELK